MNRVSINVRNPATLDEIADMPAASGAEVGRAVERARLAQARWRETGFAERRRLFYRLRDLLLDESEKLADVMTAETGRPRGDVYGTELFYLCAAIGMWAKKGPAFLAPEKIRPYFPLVKAKKVEVRYIPRGVIGIISPWNFPLNMTLGEALPALFAGNAVIVKPSELTPMSALFGAEIVAKAGFPDNLFQVVTGNGATGEALIDQADMIAFTGSVETGRRVMHRAANRPVPVSLELGGKDPMIVCADADLVRAARGAVYGAFANSGQVCTSTERVYVVEDVADVERLEVEDPARLAVLTQTTLSVDDTREVLDALRHRFPEVQLPRKDDICYATQNRQNAVKELTGEASVVIVVGAPESSNSNRLVELAEKSGARAHLVQTAADIDPAWLAGVACVGVTAGASAPEVLVDEVVERLRNLAGGDADVASMPAVDEGVVFQLPSELREA